MTTWSLPLLLAFLCAVPASLRAAAEPVVVAAYNLENYVVVPQPDPADGSRPVKPKSPEELAALVRIIREIRPGILGVCEMGRPEQFEDFKRRLAEAGLGFTAFEYLQAQDPERHLALLSRYPIVARNSVSDARYSLGGMPQSVRRGFLDVTVQIAESYRLRLVGAHLKSKLAVPEGEALLRRYEAMLLRRHLDEILKADPAANLLVYGDFNDTKNEPTIPEIMGRRDARMHLADLLLTDQFGDRWTYYWKTADQYSRFDFFFASRGLLPEIIREQSRVHRSDDWNLASDHRPIITAIRPEEEK